MRPHKRIFSFFLGLLAVFLVISPLLAAEGMKVRMRVDGDFTPREIFIAMRGELKEEEGKLLFQPLGYEQVFTLAQNEPAAKLKAQRPKEIRVRARAIGEKTPLSLEIIEWEN